MGVWLGANIEQGGDSKAKSNGTTLTLPDLGISRDQSSQWQSIAALPEAMFEKGELSPHGAMPGDDGPDFGRPMVWLSRALIMRCPRKRPPGPP